jgi:hypothetical protein
MNTLFYPPVSQEVFYQVKDSDMNMSYLTQILAVRNLILHVLRGSIRSYTVFSALSVTRSHSFGINVTTLLESWHT